MCYKHCIAEILIMASIRQQGAFRMGIFGFGLLVSIDGVRLPHEYADIVISSSLIFYMSMYVSLDTCF